MKEVYIEIPNRLRVKYFFVGIKRTFQMGENNVVEQKELRKNVKIGNIPKM